jgi:hypothetical protein
MWCLESAILLGHESDILRSMLRANSVCSWRQYQTLYTGTGGNHLSDVIIMQNVRKNFVPQRLRTCDIAQKFSDRWRQAFQNASSASVVDFANKELHLLVK